MAMSVRKPPHPSQMDPRLRRAVYAKYREMLVSKNSQANEMIKQLPAYMVREDRGFNTTNVIVNDVPPPPPPCPGKNLPAQRLQTQISEAPACVQNAMMTKDKKPFTYTPGGIDLSQIKSPRMAKRISMNANSPGVSNTPKVSPLAQISNGNSTPVTPSPQVVPTPPPAPPMGQFAMGMPFQVLPPPPPPPPMKMEQPQKLSPPQTNGNSARKSPQAFEPPPMGCRPEIKIPENPMASLRKVPKPQQKDTFWVEEFIRDQTRNSPPQQSPQIQHPMSPQVQQQREYVPSPPIQQQQQQQREFVPTPPITPKPSTPVQQFLPQRRSPSPERPEIRNIKLEDVRSASPTRVQVNRSSPVVSSSPVTVAKNVTMEPIQPSRPQNYQQPPAQGGKIILSTMPNRSQQAQQNLGSLYIPPPMTSFDDKQYLLSQQSPPWMSTKQISLDTPEWVNRDELDNFIQQTRMMHAQPKEHVVPISVEKTPTPSTMPNYGPTPFYGTPQQHINSIIQPRVDPNANKFVNQGYGEYQYPKTPQQPQQQRQQSQAGTRIIPIQVEAARASPNDNTTTVVMKSDPRQPPSPRVNAFGAPSQSRSFKILQQVTNTLGDDSDDNNSESKQMLDDTPMQEQRPIFSRPLEAKDMNETQMRRLQLSENDRAFMNRFKQQAPAGRPVQKVQEEEQQQQREPGLYQGSAIPSRSFKILQAMTQPENAADNDNSSDIEGPGLSDL